MAVAHVPISQPLFIEIEDNIIKESIRFMYALKAENSSEIFLFFNCRTLNGEETICTISYKKVLGIDTGYDNDMIQYIEDSEGIIWRIHTYIGPLPEWITTMPLEDIIAVPQCCVEKGYSMLLKPQVRQVQVS